jgi:tetratricopeptide (TPR) repeat protein
MAALSRNAPCPCGSGKKYKKCCFGKAESVAPGPAARAAVFVPADLDDLSNRANDLIRQGQWAATQAICERLGKEFPNEIDADDRLAQLYEAQGKWAPALAHAQAALDKARQHPEKFDPELVADLTEQVASLTRKTTP